MGVAPLHELSSRCLGELAAGYEADDAVAATGMSPAMWFGFLSHVPAEGITRRELPAATRLSKRAVRPMVLVAEHAGWVTTTGSSVSSVVCPTAAAAEAGAVWAAAHGRVEAGLAALVGRAPAKELRAALEDVVARFDLELPHWPITYGPVDPRVTGGDHKKGSDGPPRIPPSGQDWSPVVRGDGDTVSSLALAALVAQALVGVIVEYDHGGGSLLIATWLRDAFGAGRRAPAATVTNDFGVVGSGKSGLERHGFLRVKPGRGKDGAVAELTAGGARFRDHYAEHVEVVEERWRDRYGSDRIERLRAALEAVDTSIDETRPKLLLEQTIPQLRRDRRACSVPSM